MRVKRHADGTVVEVTPFGEGTALEDQTDYDHLEAMTDEDVRAAAATDPDNPILTPEQLRRLRQAPNPRAIRERLGITQRVFAERYELPLGTVRDWEQGVRQPDAAGRTLLRVIDQDPEMIKDILARQSGREFSRKPTARQRRPEAKDRRRGRPRRVRTRQAQHIDT
jgi:putative transcriptional regulator